jgi:hypothetical protein
MGGSPPAQLGPSNTGINIARFRAKIQRMCFIFGGVLVFLIDLAVYLLISLLYRTTDLMSKKGLDRTPYPAQIEGHAQF